MRSIVARGNRHTPKGPKGEIPGMELAGMAPMHVTPAFTANAPNITPRGLADRSDAEIRKMMTQGRAARRHDHPPHEFAAAL